MNNSTNRVCFVTSVDKFLGIPSHPWAYWISERISDLYQGNQLTSDVVITKQGLKSSDDKTFFRYWVEVDYNKIDYTLQGLKWVPLNKGGTQKWYGDNWYVINWEDDGKEIKDYAKKLYGCVTRTITSMDYYFKECLTWPQITSNPNFRYIPNGFIFNAAGPSMFVDDSSLLYVLGFLNTKIVSVLTRVLNPTVNLCVTDLLKIPFLYQDKKKTLIEDTVQENIKFAKEDWDSFETSWDFKKHPLI